MSSIIALYIRLSVDDEKTDSLSIANQRLLLREKAATLEEYADSEIMEFVDNGHSGTNFERPAVQQLLDMVRTGKICCIIVKDLSRFGRNSIETGYFIEKVFPLYHIRFISVSDDFDTNDHVGDTGGIELAFKYLINECYSADLSRKIKSSYQARMIRGDFQNTNCIYGYVKGRDGKLEIDEEAAENVRMIFDFALQGLNTAQIAHKLYELHIPTPGEYKKDRHPKKYDVSRTNGIWVANAVRRILTDERYTGTYIAGKSVSAKIGGGKKRFKDESEWVKIPDHHAPIISKELFEQVNSATHKFTRSSPKPRDYLLKRKVFCGCCDHALEVVHQYHYCKYSTKIPEMDCHGLKITIKDLEQVVFDTVRAQIKNVIGISEEENKAKLLSVRLEEQRMKISALQDNKRRLYEQYTLGDIDIETYMAQKSELDVQITHEKTVGAAISSETEDARADYEESVKRKKITDELNASDTLTASLVEMLISKVYVFRDNRIEIEYAVKDFFENP